VASGNGATIGGGASNTASYEYTVIAGGDSHIASGERAAIGGGRYCRAHGNYSVVSGGGGPIEADSNSATGDWSVIGGGKRNICEGNYSVINGGEDNNISSGAFYSMAFGSSVDLNNSYRVILFNNSISGRLGINRDANDGGINHPIHVGASAVNGNGAHLTAGGVWTNASSRKFKENFQTLNPSALLYRISEIPVTSWNYKDSDERHIGPAAEDFVEAFDVGTFRNDGTRDDNYLSYGDVAGVALAGVKELISRNQELEAEVAELKALVEQLISQDR
jgi:hypothetical protein